MSLLKKNSLVRRRAVKNNDKKTIAPAITIVYKSNIKSSSFPEKIDKANKLLKKAKLLK